MGVSRLLFPKRRRHFFFKVGIRFSRVEAEQYTSYSDGRHLKMPKKHLRSAIAIMNMKNNIKPIS